MIYHMGLHAYLNATAKEMKLRITDLNSVKSTHKKNHQIITHQFDGNYENAIYWACSYFLSHSVAIQRWQVSGT